MAEQEDFRVRKEVLTATEDELRKRGLMPVGRWHFHAPPGDFPYPVQANIESTLLAVRLFGVPHEVHNTRKPRGTRELWVTREGHTLLHTIAEARSYFIFPSYPEMVRRFVLQPEALTAFDAALRLDVTDDEAIGALLEPVKRPVRSASLLSALREIRTKDSPQAIR
jgi:hypothetical protein